MTEAAIVVNQTLIWLSSTDLVKQVLRHNIKVKCKGMQESTEMLN